MPLTSSNAPRFRAIIEYWNLVEGEIKQCELLQGNVVIAAINELRYAGRRLADAYMYSTADSAALGFTPEELAVQVELALTETEQYCQRAHHDAIDSEVIFLHGYIKLLEKKVRPDTLITVVPNYLELRRILGEISQVVVSSRRDRLNRVDYYKQVSNDHMPMLLQVYRTLEASKAIVFSIKRRNDIIFWGGVAGWALAIPALYAAFGAYYHWWPFLT